MSTSEELEINGLKNRLEKAIKSQNSADKVLDILAILDSLATPSELAMKHTAIALSLKTIKKDKNATPLICTTIKTIVDKWKGVIQRRRSSSK